MDVSVKAPVSDVVSQLFRQMRPSIAESRCPGMNVLLDALETGNFHFEREQWHNVEDCVRNQVRQTPCEFLLRAHTPEGTQIPHESLIRAISETGQQRIFDTAIALAAMDQAIRDNSLPVSINISALNAADTGFWYDLHAQMQDHFADQYDPRQVTFEITEDGNAESAGEILEQIRSFGYSFAIDDLSHKDMQRLKNIGPQVSMVKIDGKTLEAAERGEIVLTDFLREIRECAKGASILAEWVKTPQDASDLRRKFNIDFVSGRNLVPDTHNFGYQIREICTPPAL